MILLQTPGFIRSAKAILKPQMSDDIRMTLVTLSENPFDYKLKTHKLKGKLIGSYSCSAGYDLRIIFQIISDQNNQESILLEAIGTHDEVY